MQVFFLKSVFCCCVWLSFTWEKGLVTIDWDWSSEQEVAGRTLAHVPGSVLADHYSLDSL